MAPSLQRVLFLSNLGADMGRPDYRLGTYIGRLEPMARALTEHTTISAKLLASPYVAKRLRDSCEARGASLPDIATFHAPSGLEDAMIRTYSELLNPIDEASFVDALRATLGEWEPDVIVCWETPSDLLRKAFLDATVLDLMPGALVRAPYPDLVGFDPNGLYAKSWLANPGDVKAPQVALRTLADLREFYLDHFKALGVPQAFEEMTGGSNLRNAVLIPFQISAYFGWADTSLYGTQLELLRAAHQELNKEQKLVCTQYTGGYIQELVLNPGNIEVLRSSLDRLVYTPSFDKLDNISQYLVPFADTTVSVSSTLGLQTKFFGKQLICPASSQLSSLADGKDLSTMLAAGNSAQDDVMSLYLTRTCAMNSRLRNEPAYLERILSSFFRRRGRSGVEQFPEIDELENTFENLKSHSNTRRSAELFNKHRLTVMKEGQGTTRSELERLTDCPVISFDVFDTLVCRTVLEPRNVFSLIQDELRRDFEHSLPTAFRSRFVELRQSAERYCGQVLKESNSEREEVTIDDVYQVLTADFELPAETRRLLIKLEQKIELSCLIARPLGKRLFEQARRAGRRILILSDFIHDGQFVEEVLRSAGYSGWEKLYVSSEVGLKKDTGSLFRHVSELLQLQPSEICHIGDNPRGDVTMARKQGWNCRQIVSTPARAMALARQRPLNPSVVRGAVFSGAVLAGFAYQFLDAPTGEKLEPSSRQLLTNPEEIGFLTLGPAMYFFACWLVREAQSSGCEQIMFFARDTVLPYRILRESFQSELSEFGITICYVPISRMAATGLDVQSPRDVWNVRIDDFDHSRPLTELLEKRFLLKSEEITTDALSTWTTKPLKSICVGDIPAHAVYRVAHECAETHSFAYLGRVREHRERFCKGMVQWGCDLSKKTMAVDIGYKGTLSKKVQRLFSQSLISRFFVSYADSLGRDPLDGCKAFYLSRQIPQSKEFETFLKYNLVIETMLNESVGSVCGYVQENEHIRVLREPNVDKAHAEVVEELHNGATAFARYWYQHARCLEAYLTVEPQILLQPLAEVLRAPTEQEARLLGKLVFDNGYAGHEARRVVELQPSGTATGGIWREGVHKLGAKNKLAPMVSYGVLGSQGATNAAFRLKVPHKFVRFVVSTSCNNRLLNKFDRNPPAFFNDSTKPTVRRIGRLLYG